MLFPLCQSGWSARDQLTKEKQNDNQDEWPLPFSITSITAHPARWDCKFRSYWSDRSNWTISRGDPEYLGRTESNRTSPFQYFRPKFSEVFAQAQAPLERLVITRFLRRALFTWVSKVTITRAWFALVLDTILALTNGVRGLYSKLRTEFVFFSLRFMARVPSALDINRLGTKRGSVTYGVDREDEVRKVFIIFLLCVWRVLEWPISIQAERL